MSDPFVDYLLSPQKDIASSPSLVFHNGEHTCIIDGFVISSQSDEEMLFSVYLSRNVGDQINPSWENFPLITNRKLAPKEIIDIAQNLVNFYIQTIDMIFVYSDRSDHFLNSFVSYRVLNEL